MNLVWTFIVRGAEYLCIQVPFGPPLEHVGGSTTVWKFVGPELRANEVRECILQAGCTVERYCETQTPEQTAERRRLMGLEEE